MTTVTVFPDVSAKSYTRHDWTADELAERLRDAKEYPGKSDCPLLKLGTFGDTRSEHGSLRHDGNVLEITGVEGDYDGGEVSLADAQILLFEQSIEAHLYTSASHTSQKPRWRVLCPLSKPYPPAERARLTARLNGALGGILAPESFALSQSYFVGRVAGAQYQTAHVRGEPIDVLDELDAKAIFAPKNGTTRAERLAEIRATDPVIARLSERSLVLRARTDGAVDIVCPFEDSHTTPRAPGDCVYFPAHTGSFKSAHFHCLHSHCAERSDQAFMEALGFKTAAAKLVAADDAVGESVVLTGAATEMDLATEFARCGAGTLLYVAGMDWFVNAGPCWQRDEKLVRFTLANRLCRAAGGAAEERVKPRIETNKTAAAVVTIARPDLIAVPGDFDCVPYELNTPGGVIDLRTGTMRQRTPADKFMHCTAVAPTEGIDGTAFADFLSAITCGDASLARFLQVMLGASLFASNALEDHWLAFLVGEGRNGKGTLIEKCAATAMGTYAKRIPSNVLLADDRGTRHPTEIANLVGARLAYASEIDEGRRWNESLLKELSGGDKLSARFMRQDLFEFVPTHRLVIYANHRPLIQNPDAAFRARLRLVPFKASFVGREDTSLPERLAEELPQILGWLVAGASAYWAAHRLGTCPAVESASADYFDSNATFDAWLDECCYRGAEYEERAKTLYASFKHWKEERGEGVLSQTRWGEHMGQRFGKRTSNGVIWRGLGLRP